MLFSEFPILVRARIRLLPFQCLPAVSTVFTLNIRPGNDYSINHLWHAPLCHSMLFTLIKNDFKAFFQYSTMFEGMHVYSDLLIDFTSIIPTLYRVFYDENCFHGLKYLIDCFMQHQFLMGTEKIGLSYNFDIPYTFTKLFIKQNPVLWGQAYRFFMCNLFL